MASQPTVNDSDLLEEVGRGLRAVADGDAPEAVYIYLSGLIQSELTSLRAAVEHLTAERDAAKEEAYIYLDANEGLGAALVEARAELLRATIAADGAAETYAVELERVRADRDTAAAQALTDAADDIAKRIVGDAATPTQIGFDEGMHEAVYLLRQFAANRHLSDETVRRIGALVDAGAIRVGDPLMHQPGAIFADRELTAAEQAELASITLAARVDQASSVAASSVDRSVL